MNFIPVNNLKHWHEGIIRTTGLRGVFVQTLDSRVLISGRELGGWGCQCMLGDIGVIRGRRPKADLIMSVLPASPLPSLEATPLSHKL